MRSSCGTVFVKLGRWAKGIEGNTGANDGQAVGGVVGLNFEVRHEFWLGDQLGEDS